MPFGGIGLKMGKDPLHLKLFRRVLPIRFQKNDANWQNKAQNLSG